MEDERWLPVRGFGFEIYEVSDHGSVRSIPHWRPVRGVATALHPGKVLKQYPGPKGHMTVKLSKHGKGRHCRVHVLVLEAFVSPRPEGMLALHRDDDKLNNHVENLYWGTYSDNMHDAVKNGTHAGASRDECKRGHLLDGRTKNGARFCKACSRIRAQERRRKHPRPLAEMPYGRPRLTDEQREAIKADTRTLRAVAEDYGITHTTVRRIRNQADSLFG